MKRLNVSSLGAAVAFALTATMPAAALGPFQDPYLLLDFPHYDPLMIGRTRSSHDFNNVSFTVPTRTLTGPDVIQRLSASGSNAGIEANILKVLNLGARVSTSSVQATCLGGLKIIEPTEEIPYDSSYKQRIVIGALFVDSFGVTTSSNRASGVDLAGSIKKSVDALFISPNNVPAIVKQAVASTVDCGSLAATSITQGAVLPTSQPGIAGTSQPSPSPQSSASSAAPSATPVITTSASPNLDASGVASPAPIVTQAPTPLPTQAIPTVPHPGPATSQTTQPFTLTVGANLSTAVVQFEKGVNLIVGVQMVDVVPKLVRQSSIRFVNSRRAANTQYTLTFNTQVIQQYQDALCVQVVLSRRASVQRGSVTYCPLNVDTLSKADMSDYTPPFEYSGDTRSLITLVEQQKDGFSSLRHQTKIDLSGLHFVFDERSFSTARHLDRIDGDATLYEGDFIVTAVSKSS